MKHKSAVVSPTLFGQGFYELSSLYLPSGGPPVPRADLEDSLDSKELRALLHQPVGDLNYQILAMLSCVNEEMQDDAECFSEVQTQHQEQAASFLLERTYIEVASASRAGQAYLNINFAQIGALTASEREPKKLFWIVLRQEGVEVGNIFITAQEVTVFSEQSVLITGKTPLRSLIVRTLEKVRIESLSVTYCRVYGSRLDFAQTPSHLSDSAPTLKAQILEVYCFQQMEIGSQSAVDVDACQIKAGQFIVRGDFECQRNAQIWTEQADVYGNMAIRGRITGISLAFRSHQGSHLHAHEIMLLVGKKHDIASAKRPFPKEIGRVQLADISCQKLMSCSNQTKFIGNAYVEGLLAFEGIDQRACVEVSESAQVFLNGSIAGFIPAGGAWFKGHLRESSHLKVCWNVTSHNNL